MCIQRPSSSACSRHAPQGTETLDHRCRPPARPACRAWAVVGVEPLASANLPGRSFRVVCLRRQSPATGVVRYVLGGQARSVCRRLSVRALPARSVLPGLHTRAGARAVAFAPVRPRPLLPRRVLPDLLPANRTGRGSGVLRRPRWRCHGGVVVDAIQRQLRVQP
ncbi:hypothetical protein D3C84_808140 [compost metagenome]